MNDLCNKSHNCSCHRCRQKRYERVRSEAFWTDLQDYIWFVTVPAVVIVMLIFGISTMCSAALVTIPIEGHVYYSRGFQQGGDIGTADPIWRIGDEVHGWIEYPEEWVTASPPFTHRPANFDTRHFDVILCGFEPIPELGAPFDTECWPSTGGDWGANYHQSLDVIDLRMDATGWGGSVRINSLDGTFPLASELTQGAATWRRGLDSDIYSFVWHAVPEPSAVAMTAIGFLMVSYACSGGRH